MLKDAVRDAPNQPAILAQGTITTYRQLNELVEEMPATFIAKEPTSLPLIVKILSSLRKGSSLFIVNPKHPAPLLHAKGPPSSLLLYTSGSTGSPKIAILTMEQLIQNAQDVIRTIGLKPNDQWKLSLPLHHVGGLGILFRCILARATLVLGESLDITHLSCIPTHLYRATPIYKKLKCILLGGAPLPNFPKYLPIFTTYGLTEMGSTVTINQTVLPHRQAMVKEDGEILVQGPTLFHGYYNQPPQKGWFPTGDLGRWSNNQLEIIGRKDWMFISGGENIQPEEIEQHLIEHPMVRVAAVLAVDDPEFGKRPIAVIQGNPSFTFKKMQSFLEERIPKFKVPIRLFFIREMPLLPNDKLDRFILSQLVQLQLDQNKNFFQAGQKKTAYL
ncbi:MAG: O-succinylbenzoic acid-CoA ligase [uncultured bacterium]|nr:MAG: O-succinylbenzoic acid-CoA ligase [uncultured bacterium]OGN55404.1 MAG: hypothetical protein A2796_02615 [Chlamydiae bacterium RIFCSPHIGHO2_01_FULL_44_39]OGN58727.1 MAG: hypothetical protein A3C42_05700 [Chlamydiae bacterium RIFCSPHIGHO2_02_FULL_45_9]OGN59908.1 MAG: hypothetical protein A3D96_03930 [Chlamydiae bacterium RIFCSPHIGHO2_12_FULL_44_59]OGN66115.1 MAG: hypothetical protein A2978_04445 [Chlamydiae bacterium RIFCSPLOWO2_01_FULL_44_52]OGN68650.1 MAG: hypothetical protein A3I67_0